MISIKHTLMTRDGLSADEADNAIAEARADLQQQINEYGASSIDPMEICAEHFGLEPDYLDDMLFGMM